MELKVQQCWFCCPLLTRYLRLNSLCLSGSARPLLRIQKAFSTVHLAYVAIAYLAVGIGLAPLPVCLQRRNDEGFSITTDAHTDQTCVYRYKGSQQARATTSAAATSSSSTASAQAVPSKQVMRCFSLFLSVLAAYILDVACVLHYSWHPCLIATGHNHRSLTVLLVHTAHDAEVK